MAVQFNVLVLNSDSLAAVNINDDRISHGFVLHNQIRTVGDFIASPEFNHLMVTPVSCAEHVGFDNADLKQLFYRVFFDKPDLFWVEAVPYLEQARFYSITPGANFDSAYIKEHFDVIFFFMHEAISSKLRLNESLLNLLSSSDCPPFMVFNLMAKSLHLDTYNHSVVYFLKHVLPKASLVTLTALSDNKEGYVSEDSFRQWYSSLRCKCPKFKSSINGYLFFKRALIARALVNTCALERVLSGAPCEDMALIPDSAERDAPYKTLVLDYHTFEMATTRQMLRPFRIVVSSSLLVGHLFTGISPYGATLLRRVRDAFPHGQIILLLDEVSYSYFSDLSLQTPLSKVYERELAGEDNQEGGRFNQLSNALVKRLNKFISDLINTELLNEHCPADMPLEQVLDGRTFANLDNITCKYEHLISECYLSCDYSDFSSLNANLVISEHPYEQMLALAHGIACLALHNDLDASQEMSKRSYCIFQARESDFWEPFPDLIGVGYEEVQARGLLKLLLQVSVYGSLEREALMDNNVLHTHSLTQILAHGFTAIAKPVLGNLEDTLKLLHQEASDFYRIFNGLLESLALGKVHGSRMAASQRQAQALDYAISQLSNYTSIHRYDLQWSFLQYFTYVASLCFAPERLLGLADAGGVDVDKQGLAVAFAPKSLNALSFGCSRGQEVCQLATLFEEQQITGSDISIDALLAAVQMQANLTVGQIAKSKCALDGDFSKIDYLNKHAYVRFTYGPNLLSGETPVFDVVSAMTVLCRHPATLGQQSSEGIYSFDEFDTLLSHVDNLVAPHGLLCLFNSNYRLEDSSVKDKYVRLFPFAPDAKLKECPLSDLQNLQAWFSSYVKSAHFQTDDKILLPPALKALYERSALQDKIGYVNTFGVDHRILSLSDKGTIFLKVAS